MDIQSLCQTLLNTEQFFLREMAIEYDQITLNLESIAQRATCPSCSNTSSQQHSTYQRHPRDLAWASWPVVIQLRVKRFFCQNRQCPKRPFAERFSDFVLPYARKTQRVVEKQQRTGLTVGARAAQTLLGQDQVGLSDTTLNRLIRAFRRAESSPRKILPLSALAADPCRRSKSLSSVASILRTVEEIVPRTGQA
jgi:transposase